MMFSCSVTTFVVYFSVSCSVILHGILHRNTSFVCLRDCLSRAILDVAVMSSLQDLGITRV